MASFKLSLLALGDQQYGDNIVEYLPSVISEFYSQEEEQNARVNNFLNTSVSFCYTYNEQFGIHTNSQKDLSFSMDRMILVNNEWVENPYAQHIQIGSQLLLEDKYQNQYLFTVTKIAYTFKLNNITYNITCQDTFNYQLTRQNDGYEIQNTSSEDDFIGAKDIDWWTDKITTECHISYQYIPLEQSLFLSKQGPYQVVWGQSYSNNLQKLIKQSFDRKSVDDKELFETFPFSGSGNAASILINLGEQLGLILKTFEHFQYDKDGNITNKLIRYFWFEPAKNNIVSGLQYSPFDSVQQFSLTHTGDALTTILNVSGPTYENEIITLLPDISPFFIRLFQNPQWSRSTYYANMFSDMMHQKVYHYDKISGGDFEIANVENNELNTSIDVLTEIGSEAPTQAFYYEDNLYMPINDLGVHTFFIPDLYEHIDFYTEDNESFIEVREIGTSQPTKLNAKETDWNFTQWVSIIDGSDVTYDLKNITSDQYGKDLSNVYLTINNTQLDWSGTGEWTNLDLYIRFSRIPTIDDETFSTIADQIPWLENKLIDFSYFTDHNLLNHYQYSNIMKRINNDLRIVNGQLIWYTQEYYSALHKKTETLANIQNMIDSLSANFNYSVVESYLTDGKINDLNSFTMAYNLVIQAWKPSKKTEILNYNETITDYLNKYFRAQQRFYKNIKLFREYFEAPVSFLSQNSGLYKETITLGEGTSDTKDNTITYYNYAFDEGSLTQTIDSTFEDYNHDVDSSNYGEVFTTIVNAQDFSVINIVSASNYTQYNYAAKLGGKDFYYQNQYQNYNLQTTYYIPEYNVELTGSGSDAMEEGLVIGSVASIPVKIYNYSLVEASNGYYTYQCKARPDPAALKAYEEGASEPDSWMNSNFIYQVAASVHLDLISSELVFSIAQKSDMIWNYKQRYSSSLPTLYLRNTDTYVPLASLATNISNYIELELNGTPFYTQFTWQTEDSSENKWKKENNKYQTYVATYLENMPIDEIFLYGPKYQLDSVWNVYNKKGYNLFQYLKDQTINSDNTIVNNPFIDSDYLSIPVANALNYNNYYHYINKSQVAKAVGTGLAQSAGMVMATGWWNAPIAATLMIGAGIAWLCAAVQDLPSSATLAQSGIGQYSIQQPDNNNKQTSYTDGWTSDFYSKAESIFYISKSDSIDQYKLYKSANLNQRKFNWTNNITMPSISYTKDGKTGAVTPAMYSQINISNKATYDHPENKTVLKFTYDKKTTYWELINSGNRNYWNFYSYFTPTLYELFINNGQGFNYQPLNQLYIKEKYYKWIRPSNRIDRHNTYYLIPLIRADFDENNTPDHISYQTDYNKRNKHIDSLPYCLLTYFVDNHTFIDSDGRFNGINFNNLFVGEGKDLIDKFHVYDTHSGSNHISRLIHYPLTQYGIKLDTNNIPQDLDSPTIEDLLKYNEPLENKPSRTAGNDCWVYSYNGRFQALFIIVQEQDYILDTQTVDSLDSFHKYYSANDISFEWTKQEHFIQGLYIPVKYDDVRAHTEDIPFNMNNHYYDAAGQRVYTIEQLKRGESLHEFVPAILNTDVHTEINLNNNKVEFTLPIIETTHIITYGTRLKYITVNSLTNDMAIGAKYTYQGVSTTIKQIIKVNNSSYQLTLIADQNQEDWDSIVINTNTNSQTFITTFVDTQKQGLPQTLSINGHDVDFTIVSEQILSSLYTANNGTFWYYYHSSDTYPILFELAAAIETQLQVYWSQAYNASLYCDYFIPRAWQFYIENQTNAFSSQLFIEDKEANKVYLNTKYIPEIELLTDNMDSVKMPNYQFKYMTTITQNDFNKHNYTALNNLAFDINIKECFDNHMLSMTDWYAEDMGSTTNYYKLINGGIKWSELLNKGLQVSSLSFSEYSGIYPMIVKYLANAYINRSTYNYDYLKAQHDAIWQSLYNQYPSVILEGNYKNDDATTSSDLLTVARNEFRDKSYPERGYTITVIDNIALLKGYEGQELKIGDSIALRASEFYNGFDDIKNSLSQYLFITDIKYTLRKDTDISLTVNSIKYKDKMLQRLVRLIK